MLSLLFIAVTKPQDDPAARFEKYMQSAKTLSVDLKFTLSSVPAVGTGAFKIKRPAHMLFTMKWGESNYSFSIAGSDAIAIEHGGKVYREYGDVGRFFLPEMDISSTPEYSLPLALLAGSIRAIVPDGVRIEKTGSGTHDGSAVDVLGAKFATQTGNVEIIVKVDKQGRALEFTKILSGEGGRSLTSKIGLSNYRENIDLPDTSFRTPPPTTYRPQTLPPAAYPLNIGENLPMQGWISLGGGKSFSSAAANKPLFIAISEPDCEVSKTAASVVADLAKKIEGKGGSAIAISLDPSTQQTPVFGSLPCFIDPTGKLTGRLRAPGTPMFLLTTAKGVVTRVWLGYDPAISEEFKKDALSWLGRDPVPQE